MKTIVPFDYPNGPNRFTTVLWLYTAAKALGMHTVPALSAVALVIAMPFVRRTLNAVIVKVWPPLREMRHVVRRCLSDLQAKITKAAKEVVQSIQLVFVSGTTLALVWSFFISTLVGQVMASLRKSAGIPADGTFPPEEEFSSEEDLVLFVRSAA